MVTSMLSLRCWGGSIVILFGLLQSGCVLYRGAKVAMSPAGAATNLLFESSKTAASTAASTAGTVGTSATTAVAQTGRVAISGAGVATNISAAGASVGGSVAGTTVRGAGSVAGGTVRATTSLGSAAVNTTGRVSISGVRGAGRVVISGVDSSTRVATSGVRATGELSAQVIQNLSRLSQAGMVTFVDFSDGSVIRVPWRAGLNVYGGSALAQVQTAERALALVRNGRVVFNTLRALAEIRSIPLQPGDVLRLAGTGG
jgi:hypothetical protein